MIELPKITPKQKQFLGFTAEFGYFGPDCGFTWGAPSSGFKMAETLQAKGLLCRDKQFPEQPRWVLTALGMYAVKKLGA